MEAQDSHSILGELGLDHRKPPELFRSPDEVASAALNGYSHALRRAWRNFDDLIGVLSVGGRPTVYLREYKRDGRITLTEHRRFWSNGVAPLLVRVTPQEVQVYSGLRPPALSGEDGDGDKRLVDVFLRMAKALEFREFLRSVEAGTVYARYPEHFDPTKAVDQQLVQNLRAARELMSAGARAPGLPSIHRVLGRVLFACYLEAREALGRKDFGRLGAGANARFRDILNLPEPRLVRQALARFFHRLGRYFRGNLFDEDLARDIDDLRDVDVATVRNLVSGNDLGDGQLVLPFDVYDFSVIPIETISAVYEDFIRAEDPRKQRTTGAYYTPPKLVDFTADLATEDEPDLTGKRVLDPGCGSGVFLVSIFNRLAEAWVRRNERARNGTRARALAKILREQICGVDLSIIACQATCFSLYMAMLDFLEPREIRRLGPERLPTLLLEGSEQRRQNGPQTVIHGDFLASLPAMEGQTFHLIVGNPPWVARGNVEEALAHWTSLHPANKFPVPARQVACAFMWEVPRYLKSEGRACLLLPAGVLLGDQTDDFQAKWFGHHRVDKIAHLSDLRFFLFPGADHPTVAIRFLAGAPQAQALEYLTPKASYASLFDNVLAIEPDDQRSLRLSEILTAAERDEAAMYWLSYNWASPRDREFLTRLRALRPLSDLVGEPGEHKRWIKGQGFQPKGSDEELKHPKRPFWEPSHRFLSARRRFNLLLAERDTKPVGPEITVLRRAPDEHLFKSPLVIFNKGYSSVAFAPFDVVFRHALQAISGRESDRSLLMFLTATLLSPLAEYFIFHLTSKAIYRGNPLLNEVLRLPFPLPADAPGREPAEAVQATAAIFAEVGRDPRFGSFGHDQLVSDAKRELVKHVYAYFDVSPHEAILIDDAVSTLQGSATPHRGSYVPTLAAPTMGDRQRYAGTLIEALQAWSGAAGDSLNARCVVSERSGVAVLTIAKGRGTGTYSETKASSDLDQVLSHLATLSPERYGSLVYVRNLAVMEGDRMHLVKPLTMRFWLRSAALNDADAAAIHLLDKRGRVRA